MKKLYEMLNKKPHKGDVGIEIECEGKGFKEIDNAIWTSHDDGSLRGRFPATRIEYVLREPIPLDTVRDVMVELNETLKDAVPDFSFRTSVHVHVNAQHLTGVQLQNFVYTYLLLEEALFQYCGNTRKCNRFCLRLQDADGAMEYLTKLFSGGVNEVLKLDGEKTRYAAINLAAIGKYGSVEFRGMRGTKDTEVITTWCHALVSLRNYAAHHNDVWSIYKEFLKMGCEDFLKHVLGEWSSNFIYKKLEVDMKRSFSLSVELPHLFRLSKEKPAKAPAKEVTDSFVRWDAANQFAQVVPAFAIPNPPVLRPARKRAQVEVGVNAVGELVVMDDVVPEGDFHE